MNTRRMTKEEVLAFRLRVANECHQQIALATVPLYKGNMETVEKTGSGVLLAIADRISIARCSSDRRISSDPIRDPA